MTALLFPFWCYFSDPSKRGKRVVGSLRRTVFSTHLAGDIYPALRGLDAATVHSTGWVSLTSATKAALRSLCPFYLLFCKRQGHGEFIPCQAEGPFAKQGSGRKPVKANQSSTAVPKVAIKALIGMPVVLQLSSCTALLFFKPALACNI